MGDINGARLARARLKAAPTSIEHLACFAYPNCDEHPGGCRLSTEETGHKDGRVAESDLGSVTKDD